MATEEITIVRNAPPISDDRRGRRRVYPWDELNAGDAFDVPIENAQDHDPKLRYPEHNRVSAAVSTRNMKEAARGTGRTYKCRKIEDAGRMVVRVWRVA